MHMATITARIDDNVKTSLYKVAEEIGIPVSSLFNAWARDFVRKKKVSFQLDEDYLEDMEMYENADALKKKLERSVAS
jgi:addiction module RelB/DinJ family antitoxin